MSLTETYVTATDEYAAFVKAAFGLDSRRIVAAETPGALPNVEALVFLNGKGRIQQAPMTPFVAAQFNTTPTNKRARLDRMWLDCGELLADEFLKHGVHDRILLPPEFIDLRPFVWKQFTAGLGYTYLVDLPYDEAQMDSAVRKQIAKTAAAGFICRRATATDIPAMIDCIQQTEQRQGFSYRITQAVLQHGIEIVGAEKFRMYAATDADGSMASCRVVLHAPGGVAIDWVAATATDHLKSGATQALIRFALQDLQENGAKRFDFAGAGLPSVSAAKACWGGRLVAYPTLTQQTFKTAAWQFYVQLRKLSKRNAPVKPSMVAAPKPAKEELNK